MRTHYAKNRNSRKKNANRLARMRAAKERKRIERANAETPPDLPFTQIHHRPKPSGFRITIEFLDDHERVQFTTSRGPHGLTISATECGRKVAAVLRFYKPAKL